MVERLARGRGVEERGGGESASEKDCRMKNNRTIKGVRQLSGEKKFRREKKSRKTDPTWPNGKRGRSGEKKLRKAPEILATDLQREKTNTQDWDRKITQEGRRNSRAQRTATENLEGARVPGQYTTRLNNQPM